MADRSLTWKAAALAALLGLACSESGTTEPGTRYRTAPVPGDFSSIPDPRSRWGNYRLDDYLIDLQVLCFCPDIERITVVVVDDRVFDILNESGDSISSGLKLTDFRTVDGVFDWIDELVDSNPHSLRVEYDKQFGFPTVVYVDPTEGVADDEREESRSNLRELIAIE